MFENARNLAVPFLTVASILIALELTASLLLKRNRYKPGDTLCNLSILTIGILSRPLFLGYIYTSLTSVERFRLFEVPTNLCTTMVAIVLTDLAYYWEHRLSHSLSALWFFHEVHHSSREFNFTTSFRLHWLGRLTAPVFFAPLIVLGFKPEQLLIFLTTNLFYQFLLHTKSVGKLSALEGILNTPSAHRVHHGRNALYINKNFGGILMLWDRIFGTYQSETETPEFGILGTFSSNNPFTVQFHKIPGYSGFASRLAGLVKKSTTVS
jgi:sterol desaturase/sphingolipid hydroxylase (fatty acid hydroxylase superfamily)